MSRQWHRLAEIQQMQLDMLRTMMRGDTRHALRRCFVASTSRQSQPAKQRLMTCRILNFNLMFFEQQRSHLQLATI